MTTRTTGFAVGTGYGLCHCSGARNGSELGACSEKPVQRGLAKRTTPATHGCQALVDLCGVIFNQRVWTTRPEPELVTRARAGTLLTTATVQP